MNFSSINTYDTANTDNGFCVSLFVSGCNHHCPGCFSMLTWDPNFGKPFDKLARDYIFEAMKPNYISGLSLLGGDPLYPGNRAEIASLVADIKQAFPHKKIYLWTGYTFDNLLYENDPVVGSILENIDVLIDGPFEEKNKDLTLRLRGSSNQRCIDVQKSFEYGDIILHCD